ncbi:MAG TPA: glycosyltransferase family 39 protein [Thermoleophilaceae bacterium]
MRLTAIVPAAAAVPAGIMAHLTARSQLRAAAAVAAGTAVVWLVLGRGYLGYDTEWALVWGGQLAGGELPDYSAVLITPTPHPLANAVGALLSPLGDARPTILLVAHAAALVTLAYQLFELGRVLIAWPVGALAAALVLTRPALVEQTLYASPDVFFLALVASAAAAEARRPRRGASVLVLLGLAGLLRPEGWLLAAAYTVYLLAASDRRRRPRLVALGAAAPVVWALADLIVTGDPFYSRHSTVQITTALNPGGRSGPSGLAALPDHLRDALTGPVAVFGVAGLVSGLWFLRRRVLLPAAICGLGMGAFLALGLADVPRLTRYAMLPASMLVLFCGVTAFGWLGVESRPRLRRVWILAALAVPAVLIPSLRDDLQRIDRVAELSHRAGESVRDLDRLAETPAVRAASRRCRAVFVATFGYRPQVALALDREPKEILVDVPDPPARGLAILPVGTLRPRGFEPVAASRLWTVTERCP